MIRFHFDESTDGGVARALRRRGMDVSIPSESGLVGAADQEHLAFALAENRVLITQDADFLALHRSGTQHAGIAYYPPGKRTVAEVVSFLCLMHDCMETEEMRGQLQYC